MFKNFFNRNRSENNIISAKDEIAASVELLEEVAFDTIDELVEINVNNGPIVLADLKVTTPVSYDLYSFLVSTIEEFPDILLSSDDISYEISKYNYEELLQEWLLIKGSTIIDICYSELRTVDMCLYCLLQKKKYVDFAEMCYKYLFRSYYDFNRDMDVIREFNLEPLIDSLNGLRGRPAEGFQDEYLRIIETTLSIKFNELEEEIIKEKMKSRDLNLWKIEANKIEPLTRYQEMTLKEFNLDELPYRFICGGFYFTKNCTVIKTINIEPNKVIIAKSVDTNDEGIIINEKNLLKFNLKELRANSMEYLDKVVIKEVGDLDFLTILRNIRPTSKYRKEYSELLYELFNETSSYKIKTLLGKLSDLIASENQNISKYYSLPDFIQPNSLRFKMVHGLALHLFGYTYVTENSISQIVIMKRLKFSLVNRKVPNKEQLVYFINQDGNKCETWETFDMKDILDSNLSLDYTEVLNSLLVRDVLKFKEGLVQLPNSYLIR